MENSGLQTRPEIEPGTSRLPVLKRRTAQFLLGPRTDCFNIHAYPTFEPGFFGTAADYNITNNYHFEGENTKVSL